MTDREKQASDDFWAEVKSDENKPNISAEEKEHIGELVTVPQTKRGAIKWDKADDDLCGEIPEPLTPEQTQQRLDYVNAKCRELWSQNKRGDQYFFKTLNDYRLLQFDSLDEESRNIVLDQRHASIDSMSYRKHRTELHQAKIAAQSTLRAHRRDLEAYMKLPSSCELAEDEQVEFENMYSWLLYQLNFTSMKWLKIPRSYNRPKMITEMMIRLYVDCFFSCTFLHGEQIQKWFSKDVKAWRLLLEKHVVFIAIKKEMPSVFWDLLFDEIQRLVTSGKSVIFISDNKPQFPTELLSEYRSIAVPLNTKFCQNMKFDRTSFEFQYDAPPRTEAQ